MKDFLAIVVTAVICGYTSYSLTKSSLAEQINLEQVEFATESCKLGKWKTISKNTVTCEDGAVYKYTLED